MQVVYHVCDCSYIFHGWLYDVWMNVLKSIIMLDLDVPVESVRWNSICINFEEIKVAP